MNYGKNIPERNSMNQHGKQTSNQARRADTVQRKTAKAVAKQMPAAPPVYRPQPTARVLQRKSAVLSVKSNSSPAGHRVEAMKSVWPKIANAPKVFNPNPTPRV